MTIAPVLLGLAKKYYLQLVVKIREDMLYFEDQYRCVLPLQGIVAMMRVRRTEMMA